MCTLQEAVTERMVDIKSLAAIVVIMVVTIMVRRWRSRPQAFKRCPDPSLTKDTVILHQYGTASTVPSISPFVMKLETYLRVAKVPYVNNFSRRPGPKGKLPWIEYNDRAVADSQFCVQFVNEEKKVDLNKALGPDQLATGHLVRRTVEESLYWSIIMWRLVFEPTGLVYRRLGLPSFVIWFLRRKAKSGMWTHGLGRHSQQEVTQIMEDDLTAVSQILGDKNFMFGDNVSDVTEFDCAMFGQLCQLIWQMPGTCLGQNIADKYPNLLGFCERMKSAFWPDWDQRILHPQKRDEAGQQLKENTSSSEMYTGATIIDKLVDVTSRRHESLAAKTLSFGRDRIVEALNGDFTSSVIKIHQAHPGYSEGNSQSFRSRSSSATSMLADKATLLSSQ